MEKINKFIRETDPVNLIKIKFGIVFLLYVIFLLIIPSVRYNLGLGLEMGVRGGGFWIFNFVSLIPWFLLIYLLFHTGFQKHDLEENKPETTDEVSHDMNLKEKTTSVLSPKFRASRKVLFSFICCIPTIFYYLNNSSSTEATFFIDFPRLCVGYIQYIQIPLTIIGASFPEKKILTVFIDCFMILGGGALLLMSFLLL